MAIVEISAYRVNFCSKFHFRTGARLEKGLFKQKQQNGSLRKTKNNVMSTHSIFFIISESFDGKKCIVSAVNNSSTGSIFDTKVFYATDCGVKHTHTHAHTHNHTHALTHTRTHTHLNTITHAPTRRNVGQTSFFY